MFSESLTSVDFRSVGVTGDVLSYRLSQFPSIIVSWLARSWETNRAICFVELLGGEKIKSSVKGVDPIINLEQRKDRHMGQSYAQRIVEMNRFFIQTIYSID